MKRMVTLKRMHMTISEATRLVHGYYSLTMPDRPSMMAQYNMYLMGRYVCIKSKLQKLLK
jgi:hypothetical protein